MIDQRQLIKEIPSGKFHSALMTSFSINLYYWEIQLLRSLSAKGINFVSALVDSDCLSDQLLKFSKAFSGRKPLDFSLHGYKMKGAFHPKIQFYAGRESVLVLVGSGNLTVMGHGKNLEVWSPVMVESIESPAYPFIRNVWSYLKSLYQGLGEEADNIIYSIEANCDLLKNDYNEPAAEHFIGEESIRFFTNQFTSLYNQCTEWISDDTIKTITVMSPFYDSKAELIKTLYNQYKPSEIRLIIEEGFGSLPKPSNIPDYVRLYKWDKISKNSGQKYQEYFHSKCFFFDGEYNHYMLCGSANASVAAFGIPGGMPTNHEASVGFKSATIDYFKMTGFTLSEPVGPNEIEQTGKKDDKSSRVPITLWVKEAAYLYNNYNLTIDNSADVVDVTITFYSGNRKPLHVVQKRIKPEISKVYGTFKDPINPLYVEITNRKGELISNRQFVIPTEIMEVNNPSPESEYKRKRYREIESGKFINGEVLRFIEQILNDAETKMSAKSSSETIVEKTTEDKDGHTFSSVDDYLKDDGTGITGDRSMRKGEKTASQSSMLFDSMISYISRSSKEKEDEDIDEEETEDVRKSEGREKVKSQKTAVKSQKKVLETEQRIYKMYDKYITHLESVALSSKTVHNDIHLMESLKKYMTAIFFLYRTFSYRYTLDTGGNEEHSLIYLKRSATYRKTATEYCYRLTSLFALYLMKSTVLEEENNIIKKKDESYKQYAFELCLAVFSICDWINMGNRDYKEWASNYKAVSLMTIRKALETKIDENTPVSVFKRLDRAIQELDGFDKANMEQYIHDNVALLADDNILYPKGCLLWSDMFGYVHLKRIKPNMAVPLTMAYRYNKMRGEYCPDYLFLYDSQRLLQVKPSNK
ncbi:hypothetical protein [Prevotella sp. E2-28]|uniref:hypothetical protein n=1 Tax=Prevotella sp. E2-28 TaxID=2913620 RepID=UPI001EDA1D76|nr:hypothetical protein [Prevotella sp. E2-28]UKK52821.1 hypothetical protein L6465_09505 [Prevotella sp. E2-28]